jgi:hypothetical protein
MTMSNVVLIGSSGRQKRDPKPASAQPGFHDWVTCERVEGLPPPEPCRFCGTIEYLDLENDELDPGNATWRPSYFVRCQECWATGPSADSAKEAAELWNGNPGAGEKKVKRLRGKKSSKRDREQAFTAVTQIDELLKVLWEILDQRENEQNGNANSSLRVLVETIQERVKRYYANTADDGLAV